MGIINLRAKVDPSVFTEIRTVWDKRCTQVDVRKNYEKEIDKANKEIFSKISIALKDRTYLKNVKLRIRDTEILMEKCYSIRNTRDNSLRYFSVSTTLPSMIQLFDCDKNAKNFPKLIEKNARILDKLAKRSMKNHGISEMVNLFQIILETSTKYSF